ncbi:RNA binding motif protein, X-linked-like-1 isoform X1 [Haliotis rubra]|uniref:RNA binding motif protein, X-linked-like-1 isoform X1 n=1 Tax=Haliotis rubra TaxID=36100 RepID=UPI001EE5F457|nr:RNA binding motif protein, X-linked-like-1 isoform X1 [Haliotis rubra]
MIEQDRPGKIFVGGLTSNVDRETLENAFAKFGRITEVLIIRDKITNQSRGYGFITYENPLDAEDAVKGMDGEVPSFQTINGKEIHVEQAVRAIHDDRGGMRSGRGGRSRGGSSMRSRGSRGGLSSRRGGFSSRDSGGSRDGSRRMDSMRRGSPPPRRGSSGMRGRGRGGPVLRKHSNRRTSFSGRSSSFGRRDMTPPRKSMMLHSSPPRYSDGPSRRYNDSPPPRRMSSDYDRRDSRFTSSGLSDRLPPRGRDMYQSSPPRDSSRLMDSRMSSGRGSRDYQSSRDYPPQRDYNSRNFTPEREPIRSRMPPQRDSYSLSSRDDRRDTFTRSSGGRDYLPSRGGGSGDYISSRDSGRDYNSSRDYSSSSRDYQSSRDVPSRDYGSRFDSHDLGGGSSRYSSRDVDRPTQSRGPPLRSYDALDDLPPSRNSYSSPAGGSRGPPSRSGPSFSSPRRRQ